MPERDRAGLVVPPRDPKDLGVELAEAIKPLLGTMNYYFGPGARTLSSFEQVEQYRRVAALVNEILERSE